MGFLLHLGRALHNSGYSAPRLEEWQSCRYCFGTSRSSRRSTASGFAPRAMPVRLATLKMCVSTATVGSPNATLSTTLAVLRPTPGSRDSQRR